MTRSLKINECPNCGSDELALDGKYLRCEAKLDDGGFCDFEELAEQWERTQEITKFALCPLCDGSGKHVNPSIDAHGISADEFADDPDFADDYFSGAYDVVCVECNGLRVVAACSECDEPALAMQDSPWPDARDHTSSEHYSTCYEHLSSDERADLESLAESYAIQAAEIAMGA